MLAHPNTYTTFLKQARGQPPLPGQEHCSMSTPSSLHPVPHLVSDLAADLTP